MLIEVLKSKLHCVQVTEANLNYMGSITIDEDLMDAANLIAGEKVQIVNNNKGVLQTKVNSRNEKSPAKFTRPKMSITKQAGEKTHRQPE